MNAPIEASNPPSPSEANLGTQIGGIGTPKAIGDVAVVSEGAAEGGRFQRVEGKGLMIVYLKKI